MLTESLLLASLGAALGVVGAYWAVDLLVAATGALPFPLPYWIVFSIDTRVLAFTVGAAVFASVASGLIPAWLASRTSANDILKDSGRGHTGRATTLIIRSLVVFQILVTCILLVGSLLLVMAEDGEVVLIDPQPDALRELTRFTALAGKTWNPPALAGRYLIVRNDLEAACYRLPVASATRSAE